MGHQEVQRNSAGFFLLNRTGPKSRSKFVCEIQNCKEKDLPRLLPGGRQVGVGLGDAGRGLGRVALLTDFNQRLAPFKTPEYPVPLS